jgi:hypothetical protein
MTVKLTKSTRPEPVSFTETTLVLVEGDDDQVFIKAVSQHLSLQSIQIHNMNGKTSWASKVRVIAKDPGFHDRVKNIALVRDSDDNPVAALESCRSALQSANLPCPSTAGGVRLS